MRKQFIDIALLSCIVTGCASYEPKSLPSHPSLIQSIDQLHQLHQDPLFKGKKVAAINAVDGVSLQEIELLALSNNPDLKAARAQLGITQAQAFAAGLLPDPQLGWSRDYHNKSAPDVFNAYNTSISYDLNSIIAYSTTKDAAHKELEKVNLGLLWQEWQILNQARLLSVQLYYQQQILEKLRENQHSFSLLYAKLDKELGEGNATIDQVSASLSTLQDIQRQVNAQEVQLNDLKYQLNSILGVAPELTLTLTQPQLRYHPIPPTLSAVHITKVLKDRPDIMALAAGYAAQDARFRQAILLQFPAVNLGIVKAKDNSNLHTHGFTLALNLPIFNRNQGNIAIEKATREALHQEYQNRLNQGVLDIHRILTHYHLVQGQLEHVLTGLKQMHEVDRYAEKALDQGNLDMLSYTNLKTALLNKEIEHLNLEQAKAEQLLNFHILMSNEAKP